MTHNGQQGRKEYPMAQRKTVQETLTLTPGKEQIVLGKPGSHMQKNQSGPLSYTIYIKNKFKMDERPKCET